MRIREQVVPVTPGREDGGREARTSVVIRTQVPGLTPHLLVAGALEGLRLLARATGRGER